MAMSMSNPSDPAATRCPLCKKPTVAAFRPFCSRGCQDRDLLKWLGGGYALPARSDAPDDDPDPGPDAEWS
jgi:uncharacterized protein